MSTKLSTGVENLDVVLRGGLLSGQAYLVRGQPGSGKTTLAMQFLQAGVRRGEPALYITLAETEAQLRMASDSHGWDLDGVHILDIRPSHRDHSPESQYTIFHPADVEMAPVTKTITEAVERIRPIRVVFDSLTEFRLLTRDLLRYRMQALALIDYLTAQNATSLFLGESGHPELDVEITPIVQGVLSLSLSVVDGLERRSLRVEKYRASDYHPGEHALRIVRGGLQVFPHLLIPEQGRQFETQAVGSGNPKLDQMLGGGLDKGTCTLIVGNSGCGKTTLGLSFLATSAERGERAVLYTIDEEPHTIAHRCEKMGMNIRESLEQERLHIRKVNPYGLYPDEFASWVQEEVERRDARMVMIDTLNGLDLCMDGIDHFVGHLHQLVNWLRAHGVSLIAVHELANVTGDLVITPTAMSYITDSIVLIKSFEARGEVSRAIGVLKKRLTPHEKRFREYEFTSQGLHIGEPVTQARGILRGEADTNGEPDARESMA